MDARQTCCRCDERYDPQRSIGNLDCAVHPLPFNYSSAGRHYGVGHYDCCGASLGPCWDEKEGRLVTGCHAADHVGSLGESEAIKSRPFVCIKKTEAEATGIDVVTRWPAGQKDRVFSVFSPADMERRVSIPLWTGGEYDLDLKAEHQRLVFSAGSQVRAPLMRFSATTRHPTHYYYSEEETVPLPRPGDSGDDDNDDGGVGYLSTFCPFYVIMRMASKAMFIE